MEPLIRIEGVSKSFGTVTALHEVSFGIGRGEFFSLLGPSGCGKTTLLRILAGIEPPTSGRIEIDGQDMARVPANRRPTNMVFQSYAIFPHLSVAENVGYGLRYRGVSRAEAASQVAEALAMVKLDGYGTRSAHELSGGQRQRVALARALVLRPKVLLLDEPLSALDRKLREEMQVELRTLQRQVGITFVFVTHDQGEALTLSDRIAVMEGGRILQIDTPRGLYEQPASVAVAGFIGTMNMIPVTVVSLRDGRAVADAGAAGRFEGKAAEGLGAGAKAVAAVRPERVSLASGGANSVAARIRAVSFLGDRVLYVAEVPGLAGDFVVVESTSGPTGAAAGPGVEVALSWPVEATLILPQKGQG